MLFREWRPWFNPFDWNCFRCNDGPDCSMKKDSFSLLLFVESLYELKNLESDTKETVDTYHSLGLQWNQTSGIIVTTRATNNRKSWATTQRNVFKCVTTFFDPISLVSLLYDSTCFPENCMETARPEKGCSLTCTTLNRGDMCVHRQKAVG